MVHLMQVVPMSRSNGGRKGHISPDLSLVTTQRLSVWKNHSMSVPFPFILSNQHQNFHILHHPVSGAEKSPKIFVGPLHKVLNKCRIKVDVVCNDITQEPISFFRSFIHFSALSVFKYGNESVTQSE